MPEAHVRDTDVEVAVTVSAPPKSSGGVMCNEQARAGKKNAFRCTVSGIVKSTGLSEGAIKLAINKQLEMIRPDKHVRPATGNLYLIVRSTKYQRNSAASGLLEVVSTTAIQTQDAVRCRTPSGRRPGSGGMLG